MKSTSCHTYGMRSYSTPQTSNSNNPQHRPLGFLCLCPYHKIDEGHWDACNTYHILCTYIMQSIGPRYWYQVAQHLSHSQQVPCIPYVYMALSSAMLSVWHPICYTSQALVPSAILVSIIFFIHLMKPCCLSW